MLLGVDAMVKMSQSTLVSSTSYSLRYPAG